jgi:outer membrane protein TolC
MIKQRNSPNPQRYFHRRSRPFANLAVALLLLGLLVSNSTVYAANPLVGNNPDSLLVETLKKFEGTAISLNEAQSLAIENATTVQEAMAAFRAAKGSVRKSKGAFDPELFATAQRTSTDVPSSSPFSGADILKTKKLETSTGVRIMLPFGTKVEASISAAKTETNSSFAVLDPQFSTEGKLLITQPLLKGFGPSARSELTSLERDQESAYSRYQEAVLSVVATVEQTYWDLYAAERDLAVQILIRDQASSFLTQTKLRAASGLIGPNQVANAQVFLAEQEQAVLDREESLDGISDQLATLLGKRPENRSMRYRPADEPAVSFAFANPESLMVMAIESNRNVQAARDGVAAAKARERGARWDALPTLDLIGSLGGTGLAGTGNDVVVSGDTVRSGFTGSFGDAYGQALKREHPTWSIGVRLSYPIGSRAGGGERDRLVAETSRAQQQYLAAKLAVEEDVRRSYRELAHAEKRLQAARNGVDASTEQVRIGTLEYDAGRTTAFELVRLAADLAAAQQRYSQALVRAAKAASELKRLTSGSITTPVSK